MNPGGAGNTQAQWKMYKIFKVCSCKACWSKHMGVEGSGLNYCYSKRISVQRQMYFPELLKPIQVTSVEKPRHKIPRLFQAEVTVAMRWSILAEHRCDRNTCMSVSLCVFHRGQRQNLQKRILKKGGTWSKCLAWCNTHLQKRKALISEQHQTNMCSVLAMEKRNTRPALFMTFRSRC